MISISEGAAIQSSGGIRAFAYVTTEKAALYRAIMRVFMESKARFAFHLRPQEILDQIRICAFQESPDQGNRVCFSAVV